MELSIGDVISVQHYSGVSPLKSIVEEIQGENLSVRLTKEFAVMNFLEGDPVVCGYELENKVYIYGSTITKISPKKGLVGLQVDKLEEGSERRQFERYPVSLYADMRLLNGGKRMLATIKDISYYGLKAHSKEDLDVNQVIGLDIYMEKSMVFLKANVVRKAQTDRGLEYGLGIVYEDTNSINFMKDYIRRLHQAQEENVRKIKHMR